MKSTQATILVADDEAPSRLLIEQVLSSVGYTVLQAENSQRALEVVRENEIDLILMDVRMPVMNGHEAVQQLKTSPKTRQIPIIMLTGLGSSRHKVAGFASGADEYVTKPISGLELVARVNALLRLRDMQRELLEIEKEKFASKLAFASEVQSKLLPKTLPELPSLDIAITYLPCHGIGGDFYDHFAEGDERLFLALGDGEGHGMNAALLMARAGAFLRSTLRSRNFSPSTLLSAINDLMCDDHCDEVLLPMVAFFFDMREESLRFGNAGHVPPLFYSGSKKQCITLGSTGPLLGVDASEYFEESKLPLGLGDIIVCFTDGLNESVNGQGQEFGNQRIEDLVRQNAQKSSTEISSILVNAWKSFTNEIVEDDMTLIVVKRKE